MRRPSPLPSTPPAAPRRSAPTPTPETEPAAEAAPERVESAAPGRLAPVVPLEATASSAAESNETAPDAAADRPLGVRDVWAAARARRRALRREVRRFTVRQRRRRYAWLGALAAVVLLGVGAVGAAYSPLFAVSKITVIGTQKLAPAAIEQALAGEMGTPLALVDSSAVKAALVSFPLVESYSIEARPPQELVVRIIERTPVGVVSTKAGFSLVDAAGVVLGTTAEAPKGYPVIEATGGAGSRAFRAVGAVYRSLPADLRKQVSAMSATTPDDVTLEIEGADVLWGSAEQPVEKARVLKAAIVARPPSKVEHYDVSSPSALVIR